LYVRDLTPGSKAANTLATEAIHSKHLVAILGNILAADFVLNDLDAFVAARTKVGRNTETIKQEIATLRMTWNWAKKRGHVPSPWTWKLSDLDWPKTQERERFRTWGEIERRITPKTTPERVKALWECLYLDEAQVTEFLDWIKANARHDFIHPLFSFAAFTGARRGELLRSERDDFWK
jgi:integrase